MCAGTVVAPPGPTSAEIVSVISTSRSVALKASLDFSALISTLARIGMVFRRSTTRWTWPSDLNSAARSTVTFIVSIRLLALGASKGGREVGACARFSQGPRPTEAPTYPTHLAAVPRAGVPTTAGGRPRPGMPSSNRAFFSASRRPLSLDAAPLLLQLAFEQLDLFGERGVRAHEIFDLSHGV